MSSSSSSLLLLLLLFFFVFLRRAVWPRVDGDSGVVGEYCSCASELCAATVAVVAVVATVAVAVVATGTCSRALTWSPVSPVLRFVVVPVVVPAQACNSCTASASCICM